MLLCKYPVRLIFLDDDVRFLKILKLKYKKEYPLAEFYSDADQVVSLLKNGSGTFLDNYLMNIDERVAGQRAFSIDIPGLRKEIKRQDRDLQIGVVIIDQQLANKDGLSILKEFNDAHFFKILLTANVSNDDAVKAFNEGLIDGFVTKNNINMLDDLHVLIDKGVEKYFDKLSNILIKSIKKDLTRRSALGEIAHTKLLESLIKKFDIKEYHLLDAFGSYVLIDDNDKCYFLLINDSASISAQLDILSELNIPENIFEEVAFGQKMLYLPITENRLCSIQDCLFDCKDLDDRKLFSYSVVSDGSLSLIE